MCLAIPSKITQIKNNMATIDVDGVQRGQSALCGHHPYGQGGRAVGKKLFEQPYRLLRKLLKSSKVRTDLWALLRDLRRYAGPNPREGCFGNGVVREDLPALVLWVLERAMARRICSIRSPWCISNSTSAANRPCNAPNAGCRTHERCPSGA